MVENLDFRTEEAIYQHYRALYPAEWERAPDEAVTVGFTTITWPLLTFGWDLFLRTCLDPRFERIMDEFAEINRRVFRAFSRLPINFCVCHDDIVCTRGPVCSPRWMHKYVFPRYEEYWAILKQADIEVLFMSDGNMDAYADVMACGARGIIGDPTPTGKRWPGAAPTPFGGRGDNRVLTTARRDRWSRMVGTGRMCSGYMMCIGNHILEHAAGRHQTLSGLCRRGGLPVPTHARRHLSRYHLGLGAQQGLSSRKPGAGRRHLSDPADLWQLNKVHDDRVVGLVGPTARQVDPAAPHRRRADAAQACG